MISYHFGLLFVPTAKLGGGEAEGGGGGGGGGWGGGGWGGGGKATCNSST